jgi:hypothetical protein
MICRLTDLDKLFTLSFEDIDFRVFAFELFLKIVEYVHKSSYRLLFFS